MLLALPVAAAEVRFVAKPTATAHGKEVKIAFEVSSPTDVEVAVLDAKGTVVRHLAAGLLGKNAPAPFKKDSLAQEVVWDKKDDARRPAPGGPFRIRISIGATPRLEKIAGWDGATLGSPVAGMVVGKNGELYVLDSEYDFGRAGLRAFDRDGKYLRTIVPYPANTSKERAAGVYGLEIDGERFPMVASGHSGSLLPLFSGMQPQTPAWHPKGHLVLFSAAGSRNVEWANPRHLLALHPEGGAPEGVEFVGPQLYKPGTRYNYSPYDRMAISPDGEYVYLTTFNPSGKTQPHAVYRVKWVDKDLGQPFLGKLNEAGTDDAHLDNPQGLATDKAGNLYVCDSGNNRIMVYDKDGGLLGKFAVEDPYQVAVYHGTGEIYVLSRKRPTRAFQHDIRARVLKFPAFGHGEPKELARIEGVIETMALDPKSSPARLWAVAGKDGKSIVQVLDKGHDFEFGETISSSNGLEFPMYIAADPARNRVLVYQFPRDPQRSLFTLDLDTNKVAPLGIKGMDIALDRDGNIYVMDGYDTNSMSRYTPAGKPLPFEGLGSNKIHTGIYRAFGTFSVRGLCVAPNGDIYVERTHDYGLENGTEGLVDVFGPDGKRKKASLINNLPYGSCGLAVDAAGNVYLGVNLKDKDQPYPEPFLGKVSAEPYREWKKAREKPWHYSYFNPYLFHWGSVMKFGPEGGTFWGIRLRRKDNYKGSALDVWDVAKAPADALALKSGYLQQDVKVSGAKWRYVGCGVIPTSDLNWGDPSCACVHSHLAADEYGRVFAPDPFRFSVEMLDTNGNQIARIGRYGNADSAGPGSKVPDPEIALAWPNFVSVAGGKVYVCDSNNRRITVVRFDYGAEETCETK
jgi:sugar lactone lactonase YvrE